MTEEQAKRLIATMTLEEKIQLNEMLKAIEQKRTSKSKNTGEVV